MSKVFRFVKVCRTCELSKRSSSQDIWRQPCTHRETISLALTYSRNAHIDDHCIDSLSWSWHRYGTFLVVFQGLSSFSGTFFFVLLALLRRVAIVNPANITLGRPTRERHGCPWECLASATRRRVLPCKRGRSLRLPKFTQLTHGCAMTQVHATARHHTASRLGRRQLAGKRGRFFNV